MKKELMSGKKKKENKGGKNGKKSSTVEAGTILRRFLKTYEKHCVQTQSIASITIAKNVQYCCEHEKIMTKILLASPEAATANTPPVYLKPLLMTIRDERYMFGKELCIWNVSVSNQDIADLSLVLELCGRTRYPFTHLELLDCGIDVWSAERLGKAMCFSALQEVNLDYNEFSDEGLKGLLSGLSGNCQIVSLSLCYCNLGPASGYLLGLFITQSAVRDLYVNGNQLQCDGALDLIRMIAEHAENVSLQKRASSNDEDDKNLTHHHLEDPVSEMSFVDKKPERMQTAGSKSSVTKKKRKHKGKKKSTKKPPEVGPWLVKLHLADNEIDAKGEEGLRSPLQFIQMLCLLIKFSEELSELDMDDNNVGDLCGRLILEALKERKEAKLPDLKVKVTAQMNADTFSDILKQSQKLKSAKKSKKKKKKK
ncbi:uncharacterized protein LOC114643695 [Erpetoichthys calabaricus]|uniref:uncharacterized protein LOC114643695 n=1 Tax=Erpetoichthys calabaricus TaxID=27687 RepID=UPI0022345DA5|nr:uncharacterized protein LOC114643695 [Erpetoichthys calabaricus]